MSSIDEGPGRSTSSDSNDSQSSHGSTEKSKGRRLSPTGSSMSKQSSTSSLKGRFRSSDSKTKQPLIEALNTKHHPEIDLEDNEILQFENTLNNMDVDTLSNLTKGFDKLDTYYQRQEDLETSFPKSDIYLAVIQNPTFTSRVLKHVDQMAPNTFYETVTAERDQQTLANMSLDLLDNSISGEEKTKALNTLQKTVEHNHILKPFLESGLRHSGISAKLERLKAEYSKLEAVIDQNPSLANKSIETILHINDRMCGDLSLDDQAKILELFMRDGLVATTFDDYLTTLESLSSTNGEFTKPVPAFSNEQEVEILGLPPTLNVTLVSNTGDTFKQDEITYLTAFANDLQARHVICNTQFFHEEALYRMVLKEFEGKPPITAALESRTAPKELIYAPGSGISFALVPSTLEDGFVAFRVSRPNGESIETHVPLPDWVKTKADLLVLSANRSSDSNLAEVIQRAGASNLPEPDDLRKMISDWQLNAEYKIQEAIQEVQRPKKVFNEGTSDQDKIARIIPDRIYTVKGILTIDPLSIDSPAVISEETISTFKNSIEKGDRAIQLAAKLPNGKIGQESVTTQIETYKEQALNFIKITSTATADSTQRIDYFRINDDETVEQAQQRVENGQGLQQHFLRMQSRLLTREA